jgi:ATP synthase, F1 epsilon subunit (delta in mitochondria)
MSEEFKIEVISPEKSFFSKEKVKEVVIPGYEGEIGILKDHISLISFLKPGIIKVFSKDGEEHFYVDDGIVEFKDNALSILTSSIFNVKEKDINFIAKSIESAEKELLKEDLNDQNRFLINHKIDILKSLSVN